MWLLMSDVMAVPLIDANGAKGLRFKTIGIMQHIPNDDYVDCSVRVRTVWQCPRDCVSNDLGKALGLYIRFAMFLHE
jgi:hypothetical protein